jgi:hypothetical protein
MMQYDAPKYFPKYFQKIKIDFFKLHMENKMENAKIKY